jgi:membrane fusion protein, multidrug efflux system
MAAAAAALLAGCGDDSRATKPTAGPPATLVSVVQAEVRPIEITEDTVGTVENVIDPTVAAEVAGRVVRALAPAGRKVKRGDLLAEIDPESYELQNRSDEADVKRLETLVANQERIIQNQQKLVEKAFISQNALDESVAQRDALGEQLKAARARLEGNMAALRRTRVVAPIDGEVEVQIVAAGDYVKVGDPMFRLVGMRELRAHLPFPESAASRLRVGQTVRLSSPLVPGTVIDAKVDDIRPTVTATSRALDVIVRFQSDGRFRGGGTVNAEVVTGRRGAAVMVPEQGVILRPAGKVVYLVEGDRAVQRVVETGVKQDGWIEIVAGLAGGERIAADGAGFLTDGTPVAVAKPRTEPPGAIPPPPTADAPKGGKAGARKAGAS